MTLAIGWRFEAETTISVARSTHGVLYLLFVLKHARHLASGHSTEPSKYTRMPCTE